MAGKLAVAAELAAAVKGAARRFGDDDMARLRRGGRELRAGEESLGRVMSVELRGNIAHSAQECPTERQREAARESLGLRRGPRLGM